MEFLGLVINSKEMTISLPEEKLRKVKLQCLYSRHPLPRTPKGAAKKFKIKNVRDSEKPKKKNCILHTLT